MHPIELESITKRFKATEKGGGEITIGTGLYLTSGRCALLRNGQLFLALTGRGGTPNRFQRDGEVTEIPFNGYFTSVTVE